MQHYFIQQQQVPGNVPVPRIENTREFMYFAILPLLREEINDPRHDLLSDERRSDLKSTFITSHFTIPPGLCHMRRRPDLEYQE